MVDFMWIQSGSQLGVSVRRLCLHNSCLFLSIVLLLRELLFYEFLSLFVVLLLLDELLFLCVVLLLLHEFLFLSVVLLLLHGFLFLSVVLLLHDELLSQKSYIDRVQMHREWNKLLFLLYCTDYCKFRLGHHLVYLFDVSCLQMMVRSWVHSLV